MTSIDSVTLEVADPTAAHHFYASAFGLGPELRLRASDAPTTGFRGFTLSLTVSQPATASALIDAALRAGATPLKPAAKSLWGFGGVVQAPDGTIWKVATSKKKNTGPATGEIDKIVLLLGAADVAASKRFYVDRGLAVAKSFGAASTSSSTCRRVPSRSVSTAVAPSPRTPASLRMGVARTGSSSAATPCPSPTRTGSSGKDRAHRERRLRPVVCRSAGRPLSRCTVLEPDHD